MNILSSSVDDEEVQEWCEALEQIIAQEGAPHAASLLHTLHKYAQQRGVCLPAELHSPYVNTIPAHQEPPYPGNVVLENRFTAWTRWNAAMMVARANRDFSGLGGHISTYASAATLYEVAFQHFFQAPTPTSAGDQIFFQGHASPGIYARAFLEGRLTENHLLHFRRETTGHGLSSYPHPQLMPSFWQFPTVSMGLGPIHAIYQARFNRYLHQRGLAQTENSRVWAFLGDGECDEPESLGALSIAAREGLHRLVFVINCNLQRLDGPVRGNGKIIQELEGIFHGAGWHVIKVIWDEHWDPLWTHPQAPQLQNRLLELLDGDYQRLTTLSAADTRDAFFTGSPELTAWGASLPDETIAQLNRGGHSLSKVYAAYHQAVHQQERPVVILAKTVKGFLLGNSFEASNSTHQIKKLDIQQLKNFRDRLEVPITDEQLVEMPFYHPGPNSPEIQYAREQREKLGGSLPQRRMRNTTLPLPEEKNYAEFAEGSTAEVSTTMAFVRLLRYLLRCPHIGKHIVPIVPDEARTFGMDAFFREIAIYAPEGQKYRSVDANMLLHYHESAQGQLLEEGITEAGSMASFVAAGTAYSALATPTIPFYIFYSMFGLQRTGDQIWLAGDARARGFLLGATAGRTTLNGEGLQHADGHSVLMAHAFPHIKIYDCAFGYELAAVVRQGLQEMLQDEKAVVYYLPLYNENYTMPAQPPHVDAQAILSGLYLYAPASSGQYSVDLWASGPILPIALQAQHMLQAFDIAAHVYSLTSVQQLYRNAEQYEHHEKASRLETILKQSTGPIVVATDWVPEYPSLLGRFCKNRDVHVLGTPGFGLSDTRESLRAYFGIDAYHITKTALNALVQNDQIPASTFHDFIQANKPAHS